jgi:DNA-binding winged helix-turn-helix (wHTH) protein/tetratricopeptide (TPR) repeat protein
MKIANGEQSNGKEPEYSFGNFSLWSDGTFFRGRAEIHLAPKELAALRLLLAHAGQVVSRAQLKEALWGDVHVTFDSVPRCLSSLRTRLEPEACIQTIYKRGYRLVGPVQQPGSRTGSPARLAILPFDTGHNVAEHLGPAVAEEVTTRITASSPSWVSLLARDSVFSLARQGLTAVQLGEALKADLVLAGTLLALPTRYRLRVEMIRVADGTQIWVEDMLARQDQIPWLESQLEQRLMFRLGEMPTASMPAGEAVKPDAYDMYLHGHHEWQTHERHLMQDGMERLIQATELDPSLTSAQIDLAHLCVTQEFSGFISPETASKHIRRIGDAIADVPVRAPSLLPILGWIDFHIDRDLPAALDRFSASAHLPHDASTTRLRVMLALSRHRFEEAREWLRSALLVDPFAPWLHACMAWTWHLAGERAESVATIEKALSLFPEDENVLLHGALILAFNGEAERGVSLAQELVRRAPYFDTAMAIHAYTLARAEQRDQAGEILERLQWLSRERFVLRGFIPAAFAALGSVEEAISELRAADDSRCPWFFQMLADPRLEPLHGHPEFEQMRGTLEKLEDSAAEVVEYQC